ncbi:MAG: SxtJ family membrane protein [bacterium]
MSTHEDFTRREEIRGPSERSFGLVFAAAFLAAGAWPVWSGSPPRIWALVASAAIAVMALAAPGVLRPANRAWMKLGQLIGRITNPIITALLFFLVFTPVALVMRLMKKDPLRLGRSPDAASYWIERQPPGPEPGSMTRQF